MVRRVVLLCVGAVLLIGCTSSKPSGPSTPSTEVTATEATVIEATTSEVSSAPLSDRVLRVPQDFPTIQAAVDDAKPGELVLIDKGEYHEAVAVRTSKVVVRGVDRNAVILDGKNELDNGIVVSANEVAVENLTVRRYTVNGLLFSKGYDDAFDPANPIMVRGYRASYITAANNGLYGIYAFFAQNGIIENSYASGHPDSGIYIGQCKPCNAIVRNSVAELNAVGYEGTNASGNLFVINSTWRRNRVGVTPNSQNMERLAPQGDIVVAGNLVEDNQDPASPSAAQGGSGFGIAVGGGVNNVITKNLVRRNASVGIAITDLAGFLPSGNKVTDNIMEDNGTDLALYLAAGTKRVEVAGNCFTGNRFSTSLPNALEQLASCDKASAIAIDSGLLPLKEGAPNVDYTKVVLPPDQVVMPDASSTARALVSADDPIAVDVSKIEVPKV